MNTTMRNRQIVRILSLGLMMMLIALPVMAQQVKGVAIATKVEGDVDYLRDGKSSRVIVPTIFNADDQIITGENGFCALVFTDDKSQLKIRPNTDITLSADRNADFSLAKRVSMEAGQLFTEVKQMKGSLQIATPTAVASVKGTEFWVIFEDGITRNITLEGIVDLRSLLTNLSEDVPAGNEGEVDRDGQIEVHAFDPGEVPDFLDEMDVENIEIQFIDENGNEKSLIIQIKVDK
ncbi:MAG TPA: hypothetical protein ENH10_10210 [Bacteroidetes bacterium]|nr:fecR protein [bacterium BMS3Bbin04]HDO66379.1 hypothetical protein [Bacteroidota bacterium]HEX05504.1 hypothetical protein [Bacteroidota bacterium]